MECTSVFSVVLWLEDGCPLWSTIEYKEYNLEHYIDFHTTSGTYGGTRRWCSWWYSLIILVARGV